MFFPLAESDATGDLETQANLSTQALLGGQTNRVLRSGGSERTIKRAKPVGSKSGVNEVARLQDQKSRKVVTVNRSRSGKRLSECEKDAFLQKLALLLDLERSLPGEPSPAVFQKVLCQRSVTLANYFQQVFVHIFREKLQRGLFAGIDEDSGASTHSWCSRSRSQSIFNSSSKKEEHIQAKSIRSSSSRKEAKTRASGAITELYLEIMMHVLNNDKVKLPKADIKDLAIFMCRVARRGILDYHREDRACPSQARFLRSVRVCTKSIQLANKRVSARSNPRT